MLRLNYLNTQLHMEDVALQNIAEQVGTPTYVYSRAMISNAYQAYRSAFDATANGQRHQICYAVKANSNLSVLQLLADLGAGFDIVSYGELARVLAAGGSPDKVVFSGVGKTAHEIRHALATGIKCFNAESVAELTLIHEIALDMGKKAPVSIRINPDVDAGTHPYISTGLKDNKFGIPAAEALSVYRYAKQLSGISVQGIDCHIGSQLTELTPFLDALDRVLLLVDNLAAKGIKLSHLDVGGGLGVCYQTENPPHPEQYAKALADKLTGYDLKLIYEPGRAIMANAVSTLTQFLSSTILTLTFWEAFRGYSSTSGPARHQRTIFLVVFFVFTFKNVSPLYS